jgi:hypothetical protein
MVEFDLTARDLSYWSTSLNDWALEAGEFELAAFPGLGLSHDVVHSLIDQVSARDG